MCHISGIFLQNIVVNVLDSICWNNIQYINSKRLKSSDVEVDKVIDVSRFTVSLIDNTPVILSKYQMLQSLSIATSELENNPLHGIKFKS